jgi:hypothetical protein
MLVWYFIDIGWFIDDYAAFFTGDIGFGLFCHTLFG